MINLYQYKVKDIIKIYDGDTITAVIDLGFNVQVTEKIRLSNINAPEIRGEERDEGLKSRDFLREYIKESIDNGKQIYIKTEKDKKGKYGRYIGILLVEDINVNELMVTEGYAVRYEY